MINERMTRIMSWAVNNKARHAAVPINPETTKCKMEKICSQ